MSFAKELDDIYDNAIALAVENAGYVPFRVDRVHHVEQIDDFIIAKLRESKFVVADVTHHKQGVYFEAGFAKGLGRTVIWTCRDTDIESAHFDTRQYNHILWKDSEDLKKQLENRILAIIGRGPIKKQS
jgi:nucleoside 2-deoxyribosyltransferase